MLRFTEAQDSRVSAFIEMAEEGFTPQEEPGAHPTRGWTILSSRGVVLFYIAGNPDSTMRVMSETLGITERYIVKLVGDLVDADLLKVRRVGRRNSYTVNREARFDHPTLSRVRLGAFEDLLRLHDESV
jgi:predicted HTH transcriptional regulator